MVEVRFDDLTAGPAESFRFTGHAGTIEASAPDAVPRALAALEEATAEGLWAAGYLAYEASPGLDPNLVVRSRPEDDTFGSMPVLWFALFVDWVEAQPIGGAPYRVSEWRPSVPRNEYERAVERIREYIRAGDTYQVNHTFRLRAGVSGDDRSFYADLLAAQRAAHCAYLDTGRYRVLSASPEMFFTVEGDRIVTRPMKGTAARGRFPEEDRERAHALVSSPKERAENAMIVDLLRNDLGRISEPASVHVTSMFDPERYETVWQLTSTIESALPPSTGPSRIFPALFPSGSVTGAPKIRSMEITAELEDSPRGVYTGAVGYLAPAGREGPRMFFNVAIRTVVLDTEAGIAEFGVGGGITHDSAAAREYEECVAKARVLVERRPDFELLESIRREDGHLLWLDRHLERLASSAVYFDFRCDLDAVRAALETVDGPNPAKVRLTLSRSGQITATATAVGSTEAVTLAVDDVPVDPSDVFLFHKATRRGVYEDAAARHPEAGDVILVNERGEITEATSSNVLVRVGADWFTPPAGCGLLPGIHRAVLLERSEISERVITRDELAGADEVALVNSVRLRRAGRL